MAEYKRPKNFAEAIAMYTGSPVDNSEPEPMTEEERRKMEELDRKMHSLSKEEIIRQMKEWQEANKDRYS